MHFIKSGYLFLIGLIKNGFAEWVNFLEEISYFDWTELDPTLGCDEDGFRIEIEVSRVDA